jgi:hypothetical protein
MTTHAYDDDDDARRAREAGEPTEAAKVLYGDAAAVETNPQPDEADVIKLDSATRIAKPQAVDSDGDE